MPTNFSKDSMAKQKMDWAKRNNARGLLNPNKFLTILTYSVSIVLYGTL